MAAYGYGGKRKRAPKPVLVPVLAALFGMLLVFLGLGPLTSVNLAGLGLIFFFWGILSAGFLVISRRARRARAAR